MQTIVLLATLFGANADPGALPENTCSKVLAGTLKAACTADDLALMGKEDIAVFLAGGNSLLGRIFQKLDAEGNLTEVLDHVQRSRNAWRHGKPTPKAPGH